MIGEVKLAQYSHNINNCTVQKQYLLFFLDMTTNAGQKYLRLLGRQDDNSEVPAVIGQGQLHSQVPDEALEDELGVHVPDAGVLLMLTSSHMADRMSDRRRRRSDTRCSLSNAPL